MRASYSEFFLALALTVESSPTPKPPTCYLPNRLITLEEHAVSPSLQAELDDSGSASRNSASTIAKLKDVGAGRLADMNAGNVTVQVLSQHPGSGLNDTEGCRKANDYIRSAIDANPTRFAGFAVIPMAIPDQAAVELERSVTQLGFKGAMIWSHLKDGTYYDSPRFDPVFSMAQKLDVPIYLHPATPTQEIYKLLYAGSYDNATAVRLSSKSFGWHVDVGTHVLRLYSAGLFDRFPKLKLILGHNGEDLPMFIDRVDSTGLRNDTTFSKVWSTNIWTTTSAFFAVRQFQQLRQVSPIERIMYSVDYPFSNTTSGWNFIKKLAESNILTNNEMDMFAYKNAEKLLKL